MKIDKKSLVGDVVFIFNEMFRYHRMLQEDPKNFIEKCSPNDFFHTIPHPTGSDEYTIGVGAGEVLRNLARKCLLKEGLESQISMSSAVDALRKELSARLLKNRIEPSESSVEKTLSETAKKLRKTLRNEHTTCHVA